MRYKAMAAPSAMEIEAQVLQSVNTDGCIADSGDMANSLGIDHNVLVGVLKSLEAYEMIATEVRFRPPLEHVHRLGNTQLTLLTCSPS